MQSVGVIHRLTRYPVKSMQGEALSSAALTLQGFAEDRRYAFVQATSRSSFPWLTARELPELLYYRTSVEKAGTPEVAVTVATAHGENWPIGVAEYKKGDKINAMMSGSATGIGLVYKKPSGEPAVPSVIFSAWKID